MSTHVEGRPEFELPGWATPGAVIAWSLVAAGLGLIVLVVGFLIEARDAWFSCLSAWTFGTTVCVGALLLLMIGHAAKATWMVVTRRLTEAIVDALPLYLLLFVPLVFGLAYLYPWAAHAKLGDLAMRQAIEHKRGYLNPPFFVARTVLYFASFITVGVLLRVWSKENDERPRVQLVHRMRRLSAATLPVVGLAFTWASFDWTMSLEPEWYSTIYGLYYFSGSFVAAIALVCMMLHLSRLRHLPQLPITGDHVYAVGRLLFAMVIFWAYMAFSQLLIYWIADIPEEVTFYRLRTTGSWNAVTYLLVFGHFVGPFFLLLNRQYKHRSGYVASVAAWVFLMHFVDIYWLVMPVHDPTGVHLRLADLGAILFAAGVSCAWIAHRYFTAAPLPRHGPDVVEGLNYEAAI
jgi:hypothetical protein